MDKADNNPSVLLTDEEVIRVREIQTTLSYHAATVRALEAELKLARIEQEAARQAANATITAITTAHGLERGKYTAVEEADTVRLVRV